MQSADIGPRVVMCGCTIYGHQLLSGLLRDGFRIDHFVILMPEQGRKYSVSGYYDLTSLADQYNIPVYVPKSYSLCSPEDQRFFSEHRFDILIQGGWQRLFPESVLQTLGIGAIGVHGSSDLLPKGRGRSPLNWSIILNKKRFLLHLFLIRSGADDGDVIDFEDFDINPHDDIRTLYYKNVILTRRMLVRALPHLAAGTFPLRPQQGISSYFGKRRPEDGLIDWETMDVYEIYNLIRATTRPYPGAYGVIESKRFRFWSARPFDTRIVYINESYGSIVERFDNHIILNCLGGLLLVEDWEEIMDE